MDGETIRWPIPTYLSKETNGAALDLDGANVKHV